MFNILFSPQNPENSTPKILKFLFEKPKFFQFIQFNPYSQHCFEKVPHMKSCSLGSVGLAGQILALKRLRPGQGRKC